jgi:hypothetical protein
MILLPFTHNFSPEELAVCQKHSQDIDTKHYKYRNGQIDSNKRTQDVLVGKLAEFATYAALKNYYPDLTAPDINIYDRKEKSWKSDLETKHFYISVKGQNVDQVKRYGISWVFEKADKGLTKTDKPTYLSLVSIDLNNNIGIIRSILDLKKAVFGLPVCKQHQANKKALYFDRIEGELCHLT